MSSDPTKINSINLVSRSAVDDQINWHQEDPVIPSGVFAHDRTTGELKIGEDKAFTLTPNHKHPNQYSPIGHGHYFGYGEKWFRSTPRLWLISDLPNHPELVPLNGQVITGDIATSLSGIYSGVAKISPMLLDEEENSVVSITASSMTSITNGPHRLFGPELTNETYFQVSDQWEAGPNDPTPEIHVTFKGGMKYKLISYQLFSRIGTRSDPFQVGPSPKSWEIYRILDGVQSLLTTVENVDPWNIGAGRQYTVDVSNVEFQELLFKFVEWHPGDNPELAPGLKRLYLFGRQSNTFQMPNMPSPHPEFAYVVPYTDLGIGMKHEEVGDIVYTASPAPLTAPNRILMDGRLIKKALESDLFAMLGYAYDPFTDLSAVTCRTENIHTIGIVDNTVHWDSPLADDQAISEYFEISGLTTSVSAYYLAPKTGGAKPAHWKIEGYDGAAWKTLHEQTVDPATATYGWFQLPEEYDPIFYETLRITILTWDGTGMIGLAPFRLRSHPYGYYYLPNLITDPEATVQPYVVCRVRVEDINDDIVARLQADIARALELLVSAQNRITTLEAQLAAHP